MPAKSATTETCVNGDGCQANCLWTPFVATASSMPVKSATTETLRTMAARPIAGSPSAATASLIQARTAMNGNLTDADGCQADCMLPVCGDGMVDAGEECDDGNTVDADGCQADCMSCPVCGDGILDAAKVRRRQPHRCRRLPGRLHELPICGDGILDDGEECDDGNNIDADGCQADCAG